MNNLLLKLLIFQTSPSFFQIFSEGADGDSEVGPPLWDDVALLPYEAQQQVLGVPWPAVDPGALEPVGDMSLQTEQRQQRELERSNLNAQLWPVETAAVKKAFKVK